MEEIKPKKEKRFLKAVGKVAGILLQEFVLGLGRKFIGKKIDRIGNKRQALLIFLSLFYNIAYASIDSIPYPITGNKQRLGWQTTGNGLVWRGVVADTVTKPTSYADKNVKAYLILDSVSGSLYVFKQGAWAAISGAGGGLTMPFDSITFKTAKDGTVGVGEVEYNDTQGSLVQGLKGGNVTNVIGQQLHQRVNNRTGATLNKGDVVYLSGSQGNRITVAKALATSDPTSANTFGIVAESIADNASGYVITEGLITGLNTSALTQDSAVYLSGTTPGALTSTKPQAPIHGVYIGVCVKSNAGSGEIFVKIRNGQELDELHDVQITSPVNNASLYYKSSDGLWRDTTAALLVSDTAAMLANYATKSYADTTGRFYARQDFSNVSSSTLTWTQSDTLIPGGVNVVQVYRNGQILLPSQYTIPTSTSVVIAATSYKVGENYTVIFPRGGGAGSGGGSGSLTSITAGTGITVSPNPITTSGTISADLSVLMELNDTVSLSNRINLKLNATDTASLSSRIDTKGIGTVTSVATGYGLSGGTITTTGTLRLDSASVYNYIRDSIVDVRIGNDTIKILKQEYNNVTSDTLTWTITSKFPIQLRAYILLFRNGQLLINDQYSIIDTNKIKVAATSYKLGENYTVVTVSGIGSAGISQTGNPIYPEAGIALSTGTTWTTSIPNNSNNWNTAYTDRLKWDGGSTGLTAATGRTSLGGSTIGQSMFTLTNPSAITFPRFNADNTVSALSAANFRSAIGVGTVTSVTAASTSGNPLSITNTTTTPTIDIQVANTSNNGYLTSTDWNTFNGKQSALGFTPANRLININTTAPLQGGGDLTSDKTLSISQASGSANGFLSSTDWNTFNGKQNTLVSGTTIKTVNGNNLLGSGNLSIGTLVANDTVSLSNRINLKLNISDTTSMLTNYLRTGVAASTYQTKLNGTGFVKASGTSITYDNSTYLTTSSAASTYQTILTNPVTGTGVSGHIPRFTGTSTLDSSSIYSSNGKIGVGIDASTSSSHLTSKFVVRDNGNNFKFDGSTTSLGYTTTFSHDNTGLKIGHSSDIRDIRFTLNGTSGLTIANNGNSPARAVGIATNSPSYQLDVNGTLGVTGAATLSSTLAVTGATTLSNLAGSGTRMVTASSTGLLSTQSIPTGTVTSVSGSGAISVVNGTTTPVISVADAAFGTAGIVTATGTQQFSGDKTFEGIVQFNARAVFKDYTYTATRLAGLSSTDRLSTVTLGTGLTLSSGVLSATGGVTSVTASTPLSSSGGTTPNITIADASASASGVVNTTTQSFAGNKTFTGTINVSSTGTFGGRVNTPWLERTYTYTTSSTISVGVNTTWLDINTSVLTTLTLPNAATYPGKEIHIRQTGAGSLQSASSNIIPFSVPPTGSTSTGILTASTHRSVTLVSDGTNWIIMQRSDI